MFGHRYYGARHYGPRYFGDGGDLPPVVEEEVLRGGSSKRKRRVIRYSDFETREEYERALRIAAQPILQAPIPIASLPPLHDEDEETEVIFRLLMIAQDE